MSKVKFIKPRFGYAAGRVVDADKFRLGLLNTLIAAKVVEVVVDAELDDKKNVKSSKSGSKPRRSKGTPKSGRKRSGQPD